MASNTLQPSDYVHLHNHTQYSLLDGLTKLPALFDFAKNTGMEASGHDRPWNAQRCH